MLLLIFVLCSQPQFAILIKDNHVEIAVKGEITSQFVSDFRELPHMTVNMQDAMGGFQCV